MDMENFNLHSLFELVCDSEKLIEWCMKVGLIAKELKCSMCDKCMKLVVKTSVSDGYQWRCQVRGKHDVRMSVRKGSWFENSKLSMKYILLITYMWCKKMSNEFIMKELNMSSNTVVDWKSFCREVCVEMLVSESMPVGGENVVVEIVESKFSGRKHNSGKRVNGKWVFGGIERETDKCFVCVVNDRSKETLLDIMKKYIKPGSVVISNCWKSYDCLEDEGFQSLKDNHALQFRNPDTGAHTNQIEGTWSAIQKSLYGTNRCVGHFDSYLAEYVWRRMHKDKTKLFNFFIQAIIQIYPPGTQDAE